MQEALSEQLGRREITLAAFDKSNRPLARDLARLIEERDHLTGATRDGLGRPVHPASTDEVALQWDNASTDECRGMFETALGRDSLVVSPGSAGRGFDNDRIRVRPPA